MVRQRIGTAAACWRGLAHAGRACRTRLRNELLESTIDTTNVFTAVSREVRHGGARFESMNPALRKLGFSPRDRVVVVHADDVGICHATLPALEELMAFGLVTSASAMVPCSWFPEVAAWRQRHPDFDLGVHLTLTSEWDGYRWGPISPGARAGGLTDGEGYLHRTAADVRRYATRDAVRAEMQSQVERAVVAGLSPTHLDSHMYVALSDEFQEHYLRMGFEQAMPAFLPRTHGNSVEERDKHAKLADEWELQGQPVFDCFRVATGPKLGEDRDAQVRELFERLPVGLSCILLHPVIDTPEIRAIARDWRNRVADFEAFRNPALRNRVHQLGIQLISYQPVRDAMLQRHTTSGP